MKAWTDYPFLPTDPENAPAPVREVEPVSYDYDKYVVVRYEGAEYDIKYGRLYAAPGRWLSSPPLFNVCALPETTP